MLHHQQECFKHPLKTKQCKTDLRRYGTPVLWSRLEEKNREEIEPMEAKKIFSLVLPAEWQMHMSNICIKKWCLRDDDLIQKGVIGSCWLLKTALLVTQTSNLLAFWRTASPSSSFVKWVSQGRAIIQKFCDMYYKCHVHLCIILPDVHKSKNKRWWLTND